MAAFWIVWRKGASRNDCSKTWLDAVAFPLAGYCESRRFTELCVGPPVSGVKTDERKLSLPAFRCSCGKDHDSDHIGRGAALCFVLLAAGQNKIVRLDFDAASVKLAERKFIPGVSGKLKGGPGTSDPGRISYTYVGLAPYWKERGISGSIRSLAPLGFRSRDIPSRLRYLRGQRKNNFESCSRIC